MLCENYLGVITFLDQPQDMFVCEMQTVTIPCTFKGTDLIPTWFINATNYNWSQLKSPYQVISVANGFALVISVVPLRLNATSYKCGFPNSGEESASGVLYISKCDGHRLNRSDKYYRATVVL